MPRLPAEMARLFAAHPQAIETTLEVLDRARGFSLDQLRYEYPHEILEPGRTPQQTLEARVTAAGAERWPDGVSPSIADRTRHEFALIGTLGYPRDFPERCFRQIEGFGSYGFPESHAASFAHVVYASSWIKRHHPGVFASALLNSQPMGFYAPAEIVRDAMAHGVAVRPLDVNASAWDGTLESGSAGINGLALRLGLPSPPGSAKRKAEHWCERALRAMRSPSPRSRVRRCGRVSAGGP